MFSRETTSPHLSKWAGQPFDAAKRYHLQSSQGEPLSQKLPSRKIAEYFSFYGKLMILCWVALIAILRHTYSRGLQVAAVRQVPPRGLSLLENTKMEDDRSMRTVPPVSNQGWLHRVGV